VTRNGKPVTLTAREYVLLEYLALHRGEVVTRTQLYEHLFDENESTMSNILDVHVFNLRQKLGSDFIVTRRGGGDCGRGARILSQRWVFFAHEADGRLFTSICDNSEQATDAVITKMTKKFGAPKNPKS